MTNWLKRLLLDWLFDGLEPRQYGEFVIWTRAYDHYPWRDYWCPTCGRKLTEDRDHKCTHCKVTYGTLDGPVALANLPDSDSNSAVRRVGLASDASTESRTGGVRDGHDETPHSSGMHP